MGFLSDQPQDDPADATPDPKAAGISIKPTAGFLSDTPPPPEVHEDKVPEWGEIAPRALTSVTRMDEKNSAYQFAKNTIHPFIHPIETATSLKDLGLGLLEKSGAIGTIFPSAGGGHEKYADALGQAISDRYGSIDNLKKTLAYDPVGVLGDVTAILNGGEGLLGRVPGVVGKTAEAAGKAGRFVDPLNAVTVPTKIAGKGLAATMGYDTGAGMRNIEEAAKAGYDGGEAAKTFKKYQTGEGTPEEFVRYAMDAKKNLLKERGMDYETGMVPVKNSNTQLSFSDIGQAMTDAHKITDFKGQPINLNPGVKSTMDKIDDQIIKWVGLNPAEYHTPIGFDALKKSIGSIRDKFEVGTPEWKAANTYYKAVDNTIRKQVPEYGKVMKDYQEFSNQIEQIEKSLSLPRDEGKVNFDTATRKMQSILRRNVNTNFGQRERLADVLSAAGAPHLKAAIAGMSLSSPEAHGLVRLIPALRTMGFAGLKDAVKALGLSSPRIGGNIAYSAGRLASPLKYVPINKPVLRGAQQVGRYTPPQQSRGGAIDRALRATKRT